ncbi:MAG: S8 family serine peptidase [Verrucomicrobia bacterium]|nr:S8 family serine peptidase [Verrucomicrobiota bacterium]
MGNQIRFLSTILGLLLAVGGFDAEAQSTAPSIPAVPPTLPPSVQPGGQEGSVGLGGEKLDQVLRAALERTTDRALNAWDVLKDLNLDADSKLRVLVDVEFLGDAQILRSRIEVLKGILLRSRFGGAGIRARIPLNRLPILAEERSVILIRAVVAIVAALPPAQDIGVSFRELPAPAVAAIRAAIVEKQSRTAAQKKLDTGLLIAEKRRQNLAIAGGALERVQPALTQDGQQRVLVEISLNNVDGNLIGQIQTLGGEITSRVDRYRSVQAWMPLEELERLAAIRSVRSIKRALLPVTRVHNRTEGDVRHRVDLVRREFGMDGDGIKVGVLSNGVDTLAIRQGNGDLPNEIAVLPGQHGVGDEGTAILEIVNDLVPGAELMFASGFPSEAQMAQNILDLAAAGCDVIVDDVGHLLAPAFQDGSAAQAVESVFQQGVAYFSAAGNAGNFDGGTSGVWEGDFVASELTVGEETFVVHDFGGGVVFNELGNDPSSVIALHWADPQGASNNDYDLMLLDESGTEIVAISNNIQDGSGDPLEFIDSRLDDHAYYRIVIVQAAGEARFLRLDTFGAQLEFVTAGQVFGHPGAENAIAIGAVYQGNGLFGPGYFDGDELVESFSSDGPRRVFFNGDGDPYTPADFSGTGGIVREKPDFVAADGVSTNTPFFEQFFGTSAAAPHAAAIGALLKQRGISDPSHIRQLFESTAVDVETPGFDRKSGHGIIDAFKAMLSPLGIDDSLVRPFAATIVLDEETLVENDIPGIGAGSLSIANANLTTDQGGTVAFEEGLITYRPAVAFRGVDRFDYTVTESGGESFTASVSIDVQAPPPIPLSLSVTKFSGGKISVQLVGNPGQDVALDRVSNLEGEATWSEISTWILGSDGRLNVNVDPISSEGYLRLRSL